MEVQSVVRSEEALWILERLCNTFRIRFDPALLTQWVPPPVRLPIFHQAARALGMDTWHCPLAEVDWRKIELPVIAFEELPGRPLAERRRSGRKQFPREQRPQQVIRTPSTLSAVLVSETLNDLLGYFRYSCLGLRWMTVAQAQAWLAPELILVADRTADGVSVPLVSDRRRRSVDRRVRSDRRSQRRMQGMGYSCGRRIRDERRAPAAAEIVIRELSR